MKQYRPYFTEIELLDLISKYDKPTVTALELQIKRKLLVFKVKIDVGLVTKVREQEPKPTLLEKLGGQEPHTQQEELNKVEYTDKLASVPPALLSDTDRFNILGAKDTLSEEEQEEFAALQKKLYGF